MSHNLRVWAPNTAKMLGEKIGRPVRYTAFLELGERRFGTHILHFTQTFPPQRPTVVVELDFGTVEPMVRVFSYGERSCEITAEAELDRAELDVALHKDNLAVARE